MFFRKFFPFEQGKVYKSRSKVRKTMTSVSKLQANFVGLTITGYWWSLKPSNGGGQGTCAAFRGHEIRTKTKKELSSNKTNRHSQMLRGIPLIGINARVVYVVRFQCHRVFERHRQRIGQITERIHRVSADLEAMLTGFGIQTEDHIEHLPSKAFSSDTHAAFC